MKKIYLLVLFVFGFTAFAQQKGISYQAVIINPNAVAAPGYNGTSIPLANKAICLSFQIVNGANQVEYQESQAITTDGYGMVNVVIGTGTSGSGLVANLDAVNWNQGSKKLVVGVNTDGVCSNYTEISNQVLNYTPYSLYAQNADIKDGYVTTAKLADGAVTDAKVAMGINPTKVGLGNVNNTSDANKPVSIATQTALNLKANIASPTFTGIVSGIDKTMVGLSNVDNTTDANKPVSTATQTALNLKANTTDVTTSLALKANTSSLSPVATSGNYNDLTNKPIIPSSFALPTATASVLGGVKVGANLSIDANGVLNAAGGNNISSVTGVLPIANGGTGTTSIAGIKSVLGFNSSKVAIGDQAGQTNQADGGVGVGGGAGANNQGGSAVAIGYVAGYNNQGASSVAIGPNAAQSGQGSSAVAIGFAAGQNGQGANSVAIGSFAGISQVANSIAINATGMSTPLNPTNAGFYVAPVRNASQSNSLFYNTTTKEITYGTAAPSGPLNLATGGTGILPIVNGGTGSTIQNFVDINTNQNIAGNKTFTSNATFNTQTIGKGNATGDSNLAVGAGAMFGASTGHRNTAIGNSAMQNYVGTSFDNNTSVGYNNLVALTTGPGNTSVGAESMMALTTGESNTSIGNQSLMNTTGSNNVGVGKKSGITNSVGNNNTLIGTESNVGSNNLTNATALGFEALVTANNSIQLGNTAVTNVKTNGTLTAGAVTYPNTNGTAGQVLTANNNGSATWTTVGGTLPTTVNTSANYNIVMATPSNTALVTGTGNGGNAATLNPYTGQMSVSGLTVQGYGITSPIYASTPQALTAGATINWNPINGLNASVTLDQNSTLSFTATPTAGSYGTLVVTQDATGGRTLTLPSTTNKVLGSTSTTTIALSTTANAKDILNFYYDGTNCYWNIGQGYGTAATAATTNLATSVSGTLTVANGGTGAATLTGLVKGNGTGAMTVATAGTDYLAPTGSAASLTNFPTFNQNTTGTAANVTGTVAVANGGTGATSLTANNVLLGNGTSALQVVAPGTSGNVLTSNGTTWSSSAPAASGVPYTGATQAVDLGAYDLTVNGLTVGKGKKDAGTAFQYNSAFGVSALGNFNGGTKNTAFGYNALSSVTSTDQNIAIGAYAMGSTTDYFQQSVAVGNQSLQYNKGSFNTALGSGALSGTGLTNTATYMVGVGALALMGNTSGQNNTAVGSYALSTNTTGNNNTALGQGADVLSATLDNATAIGYNAKVSASNSIQLGNTSVSNVKTSGTLTAGTVTYPNAHGTANQVLSTSGSGTLTWTTPTVSRPTTDQFTATAAQTSFPLSQTPLNAKVWMFINGIRTNNLAYSVSGTTVTYTAANNNSYTIVVGDRIQFDYAY
jgi:carbonic anhydrase/acetyltransferase-like protein (isoleucine patch superfamily)